MDQCRGNNVTNDVVSFDLPPLSAIKIATRAIENHRLASRSNGGRRFRNVHYVSSSRKNADQKTHNGKQYPLFLNVCIQPDPPGLIRRPDPPGLKMGCGPPAAAPDDDDKRKESSTMTTTTTTTDSSPNLQKCSPVLESNTQRFSLSLPQNIPKTIIITKTLSKEGAYNLSSSGSSSGSSSSSSSNSTKEESSLSLWSNNKMLDKTTADLFLMGFGERLEV